MSTEFTVNSMHMWQGETLQSIHQYIINPVQYPPPPPPPPKKKIFKKKL